MSRYKIVLFGLGSIGKRYVRILRNYKDFDVYVFRTEREGYKEVGVKEIYTWEAVAKLKASIAMITNPTFLHIDTAIRCAQLGMHLYVEKPLDMNLRHLPKLVDLVNRNRLTAYVAYNLRFHPGIEELKNVVAKKCVWHAGVYNSSWLPAWRPGEDYTEVYSAKKDQGGGVLLDLSHEPDYIQYMFGKIRSVSGICNKVSNLKTDVEDVADLIITLEDDRYVQVHLDFCSYCPERNIKIMTEDEFYKLDLINNRMEVYGEEKHIVKGYKIERDDLYKAQIDYFIAHIGKDYIMNNLNEAGELLKKIIQFREISV